ARWVRWRLTGLAAATAVLLLARCWTMKGLPVFMPHLNPAAGAGDAWTRTRTYNYVYALNAALLVLPYKLCYDWSMGSIPLVHEWADWRNLASLLLLLLLVGGASFCVSSRHPLGARQALAMTLGLVILPFLPASNLFFPVGFMLAERVLYLPSMGVCLLIGAHTSQVFSKRAASQVKARSSAGAAADRAEPRARLRSVAQMALPAALGVLIGVGALRTVSRNRDWQSGLRLCEADVRVNPGNAKLHASLADEYVKLGRFGEAEAWFSSALVLQPDHHETWYNFASLLDDLRRLPEAEEGYRRCIALRPDYTRARNNLGVLLASQGRVRESLEHYYAALQARPDLPNERVLNNLGIALLELGQHKQAEEAYNQACARWPVVDHSLEVCNGEEKFLGKRDPVSQQRLGGTSHHTRDRDMVTSAQSMSTRRLCRVV
ncbi:hypothetical protein CYMTET_28248, partial [Cymbomonas tetramitiformis]